MKQLLLVLNFLPLSLMGQAIYSQNFDGFQVGDKIAAVDSVHWRTWSDPPGPNEDAPITDSLSRSGPNSLSLSQSFSVNSAPRNVVLLLGYHLSGHYVLSWSMYLHEIGALVTLFHTEDIPSAAPAAVVAFYPGGPGAPGEMDLFADDQTFSASFPLDTWFTVTLGVDLDASVASFSVNNTQVATWAYATMPSGISAPNILGAVNFNAQPLYFDGPELFYIDDVLFQEGTVGIHEQPSELVQPLKIRPNPSAAETVISFNQPVQNGTLTIHDTSGRMMLQAAWPPGSISYTLVAGTLAPGTYVVQVHDANKAMGTGSLVVLP